MPNQSNLQARRSRTILAALLILVLCGGEGIFPLHGEDSPRQAISGIVLDAFTHKPITNALVRVSSPAIDMRGVRDQRRGLFDGQTDPNGRFHIPVPPNPKISLNVFAHGYAETAGRSSLAEWEFSDLPFPTNREQEFVIKLLPAL